MHTALNLKTVFHSSVKRYISALASVGLFTLERFYLG